MLDLYNYKKHLGVNDASEDVVRDNALQAAINVAAIFTNTNYSSTPTTKTKSFDYPLSGEYFIPHAPIDTVTSVTFKEFTYNDGTGAYDNEVLVEDTDYFVDYDLGILEFNVLTYPKQKRGVSIEYTLAAGIPRDYILAVYELATYYVNREYNLSKSISDQDVDFKDENVLPIQVKTILGLHRCP